MRIEQNIPLAPFTTLKIGGPARFFARAETETELVEAVQFAQDRGLELFILGGGSNLLVSDAGFSGLVLQAAIQPKTLRADGAKYHVPAGYEWDAFVFAVCEAGLAGVECLAGIPGMVGGCPVQNIGAYGQEVSQTIRAVRVFDLESMVFRYLSASECGFSYRASIFNSTHRGRFIITGVEFVFIPDAKPELRYADLRRRFVDQSDLAPFDIYMAVREIRRKKGMLILPQDDEADFRSAGSFFKNPVVPAATLQQIAESLAVVVGEIPHWPTEAGEVKLPAAWLIERAGFPKGYVQGAAAISSRHTLALVNRTGGATCANLLALRDNIRETVRARFRIELHQEPVMVGSVSSTR